jgi:hypothetical protein
MSPQIAANANITVIIYNKKISAPSSSTLSAGLRHAKLFQHLI